MSTEKAMQQWHVVFHGGDRLKVDAHKYHVTEDGDATFTIANTDGTNLATCTLSRGSWQHIRLADAS